MGEARPAPRPEAWYRRALIPTSVAVLCLLGLALRLYRLGDANVWWDEGWSVWLARMSLPQLVERTAYDTNPPLYYALLHFWIRLVSESEYALRLLSVLGGVTAVAATYRLAREFGWRRSGPITAAALVAVSPFMVLWSQQARMYSWATALGLLSTALALSLWRTGRGGPGYVLVTLALLHTHTLGVLYPVLQNLMWLPQRRRPRRWILAQAVTAAGMIPWLTAFISRTPTWSVYEPVGLGTYLSYYWSALLRGTSVHLEQHGPVLATAAVSFGLCLLFAARRARRDGWTPVIQVAVAAFMPPLAVFALSQPRSFLYTPRPEARYLNLFAPSVYLLWALGLSAAWRARRALGTVLVVATAALLAVGLPAYYRDLIPSDDYRSLALTLDTYARPDDLVFLHTDSDWPVFIYHHRGSWQGVPNNAAWDGASASGFLAQFLPQSDVAWLVVTPDALRADPSQALAAELTRWCETGTCITDRWRFDDRELLRFSRGVPLSAPSTAPALVRAGGFDGLWWPYDRAQAHTQWRVYGWWSGGEPYPALRLVSEADGESVTVEPAAEDRGSPRQTVRLEYRFGLGDAGIYCLQTTDGEALLRLTVDDATGAAEWEGGAERAVNVAFGDGLRLEAASVSAETVPAGDRLCVQLQWSALRPTDGSYTVFVHLVGEAYNAEQGNFLWGQHDGLPADGARPTTSWSVDETVMDVHCFTVRSDAPAGDYLIEAGLYDGLSGQRLPVTAGGEGDRAIVGRVVVAGTE